MRAGVDQTLENLRASDKAGGKTLLHNDDHFFLSSLSDGDILAIPVVSLNVEARFPKLCGRNFLNKGFENAFLIQVCQDVEFKMDEAGAAMKSVAYADALAGGSKPPRRLLFDKPFLLTLLMEKSTQPYLALWVASPDVLVRFKGK